MTVLLENNENKNLANVDAELFLDHNEFKVKVNCEKQITVSVVLYKKNEQVELVENIVGNTIKFEFLPLPDRYYAVVFYKYNDIDCYVVTNDFQLYDITNYYGNQRLVIKDNKFAIVGIKNPKFVYAYYLFRNNEVVEKYTKFTRSFGKVFETPVAEGVYYACCYMRQGTIKHRYITPEICVYGNAGCNKSKLILAARRDGLGAKLKTLLNAIIISKKTGYQFGFSWKEIVDSYKSEVPNKSIATGQESELFSADFIATYSYSGSIKASHSAAIHSVLRDNSFMGLLTVASPEEWGWYSTRANLNELCSDCSFEEYRGLIREAWKEIDFSENIKEVFHKVDQLVIKLGISFSAIHVRSGDIIYGKYDHFLTSDSILKKVMTFEQAFFCIEKALKKGKVILFGDDPETLKTIKNHYTLLSELVGKDISNDIYIADEFLDRSKYSSVEENIFDMYLMSKASEFYIPGESNFSNIPSLLADAKIYSVHEDFNDSELYNFITQYIDKFSLHPRQKAFSYYYLFKLAKRLGLDLSIQLSYIKKAYSLEPYLIYTSINYLNILLELKLFDAINEFFSGQYKISCEDFVSKLVLKQDKKYSSFCFLSTIQKIAQEKSNNEYLQKIIELILAKLNGTELKFITLKINEASNNLC